MWGNDTTMPIWNFSTGVAKALTNNFYSTSSVLDIGINPMPIIDNATLNVTTHREGVLVVELYDLTGNKVLSVFDNFASSEAHYTFDLQLGHLPSGVYTFRASLNDEVISQPIVINR
jgi:hypothetical protein